MASRYFNPRLAAGGAAEVDPYFSTSGAAAEFERSFEKAEARRERARLIALKEKAEFNKAIANRNKIASALMGQLDQIDKEKFPSRYLEVAIPKVMEERNKAMMTIMNPDASQVEKTLAVSNFNQGLSNITATGGAIKEYLKEFASMNPDQLSNLNNAQLINMANGIANGDYELTLDGKMLLPGADEPLSIEDALAVKPILKDEQLKEDVLTNLEKIARDTASKGESKDILNLEVKNAVQNLSDADLARFGVDEAGLLPGDVAGKLLADFNEDGKIDDPEIKETLFNSITETLQKTVTPLYDTYFKEFTPKETAADKKAIQTSKTIEDLTPIIQNIKFPKNPENNLVDLNNTVFTRELARLNLRVDERGSMGATGGDIIKVTSNITGKSLNLTSDMFDNEMRSKLLQLIGADPTEAESIFPMETVGPSQESTTTDYSQFLRTEE